MVKLASNDNQSSPIIDLRYVLITSSFEKLCSLDSTVTGIAKRIPSAIHTFEKYDFVSVSTTQYIL